MVLQIVFHLVVAYLIWRLAMAVFRQIDRFEEVAEAAAVAAVLPPAIYFVMAFALRSIWWLALASALAAVALAAIVMVASRPLARWARHHWPSPLNRARDSGSIARMMRVYYQTNRLDDALALIAAALPDPAYSELRLRLQEATADLYGLRASIPIAAKRGVPRPILERVARDADLAAAALWEAGENAAATAAQDVHTPAIQAAIEGEQVKLQRLSAAIVDARESLAQMTLTGSTDTGLAMAEQQLRSLAEATRDVSRHN